MSINRSIGQDCIDAKRIVVKIGSALLTSAQGLDTQRIEHLCDQAATLLQAGREVLIVSSGAIASGARRLGFEKASKRISELQAAAAVGQLGLVSVYERRFAHHNRTTALVLVSHEDLQRRPRYHNARATLNELLSRGVVPVINENDTVSTRELKLGDNDTLSARIATMTDSTLLVLLTDQEGLLTEDPKTSTNGSLVEIANPFDESLVAMAGPGAGPLGRGGMRTKLEAAQMAAAGGCHTIITDGSKANVLLNICAGNVSGTQLVAQIKPQQARKQWLAGLPKSDGVIYVDEGTVSALISKGASLLAVGIVSASGSFARGSLVSISSTEGQEIGWGLTNYTDSEIHAIKRLQSREIATKLGYSREPEVIHRDNLIKVTQTARSHVAV